MKEKKYSEEDMDLSYTFGLIKGFSNGVSMGLGIKKAFRNFVRKVKALKGRRRVTWINVD